MRLATIDWVVVVAFLAFSLAVGVVLSRRAGSSAREFFLSGRNMPWWLLGMSMVATTFSTDTPNLVTDIVRTERRGRQLGLVGVPADRHADRRSSTPSSGAARA